MRRGEAWLPSWGWFVEGVSLPGGRLELLESGLG